MSDQVDQVDPQMMAEMRAWAMEGSWGEAEESGETGPEYVSRLSDEEVLAGIDAQYSGGASQFVRDWS